MPALTVSTFEFDVVTISSIEQDSGDGFSQSAAGDFDLVLFQCAADSASGAIAPIESMPKFFRILSFFDPLCHYVTIARSLILKGVGIGVLLPETAALVAFAVLLLGISISLFRDQLN